VKNAHGTPLAGTLLVAKGAPPAWDPIKGAASAHDSDGHQPAKPSRALARKGKKKDSSRGFSRRMGACHQEPSMRAPEILMLVVSLYFSLCLPPLAGQTLVGKGVGELYPDLKLPSLRDGKPLSLSSFRGKKVLLVEFASW